MQELIPTKVECYAGYKADEYPICFYWNDQRYEVIEIIDRWYHGDLNPEWPSSNYFKIVTSAGEKLILKHILGKDKWFIIQETNTKESRDSR